MSTRRSLEECRCECHNSSLGGIVTRHVVACCKKCPHCGKRISMSSYDLHKERCGREEADDTQK